MFGWIIPSCHIHFGGELLMCPRKVGSQYLCAHGAARCSWGATINGKFRDSKLFLVISQLL